VARLAGVPKAVIERARQLLGELAVHHVGNGRSMKQQRRRGEEGQLQLFADPGKELLAALNATSLEALTPLQAFELLREWKEKLAGR
jgi:DNA mismatch repair protein MutS